ncbi:protein kinase domain-containing protein [Streptomyces sp. NPDC002913]
MRWGTAETIRPGLRVGRFTVLAELASGGMGRVYLARSPAGRTVALKTLITDSADDRRRFAREVECAQRVRGVYTASVVDADPDAPVPWMAQEYVPAPSLKDLVESCGVLRSDALHWVAAGMAEALASLHTAGLVHRDIKPSNVLLPVEGPRVIDFGISQAHDLTRTQTALGTVAFASPEQARGEPTTEASDVFSLGATLFYVATGRPPYADIGELSAMELLMRAATGGTDVDGLAPEPAALVLPCLALDPQARPTPAELISYCADHLGAGPAGGSGGRVLDAVWTDSIERHRAERTDALRAAISHIDDGPASPGAAGSGPQEQTGPVARPDATTRLTGSLGGGAPWWSRQLTVLGGALVVVAVVAVLTGLLVLRPWEDSGAAGAGSPDLPVRILEVESEQLGVCPDGKASSAVDAVATPQPPVPSGRGFTSDDRNLCVVVSTAPGMTVNRFRNVTAFEDVEEGGQGGWSVRVAFEEKDAKAFAELTGKVAGRPRPTDALAVVQGDDRLLVRVGIAGPITGGEAVIATRLKENQAAFLASALGAP